VKRVKINLFAGQTKKNTLLEDLINNEKETSLANIKQIRKYMLKHTDEKLCELSEFKLSCNTLGEYEGYNTYIYDTYGCGIHGIRQLRYYLNVENENNGSDTYGLSTYIVPAYVD